MTDEEKKPSISVIKGMNFIVDFYEDDKYELLPKDMMDDDYLPFLVSSSNVNRQLLGNRVAPVYVDNKSTVTYTDGKNIFIGGIYLLPEFYEKVYNITDPYEQVLASIAFFNGFLIHEASHIVRPSSAKISDVMPWMFPEADSEMLRSNDNTSSVMNIVEDIHVDKFSDSRDKLSVFNRVLSNFFAFPAEEMQKRLEAYQEEPALKTAIDLLACAKNVGLSAMRFMSIKNAVRIAREAAVEDYKLKICDQKARAEIARKTWDALLEAVEEDKKQQKMEQGESEEEAKANAKQEIDEELAEGNKNQEDQDQQGQNDSTFDDALEDMMQEMLENMSEEDKAKLAELSKELEKQVEKEKRRIKAEENKDIKKEQPSDRLQEITETEIVDGQKTHVSDVMLYKGKISKLKNNRRSEFNNFPDALKAFRNRQPVRYKLDDEGDDIVDEELENYLIDKKIMGSLKAPRNRKSYPETIFLVDISGSTYSNIYDSSAPANERIPDSRRDYTLKRDMLEVVKTCFDAMVWSDMSASVYTHSTGSAPNSEGGYGGCQITAIAAHNMPFVKKDEIICTTNNEERFELAHDLPSSGNIDGYALKRVAEYFTPMATNRVLIHFSDGQPAGAPSGYSADDYVRKVSQDLRNQGIIVISMSTVAGVVASNNKLYGKDFNYAAYGRKLGEELQRVVATIAKNG